MLNLYVVRHGQSETNLAGLYCGWGQVSLTEKGFADAAKAGELLKDIPFEKVYASDLLRAIQTCQTALPGAVFEQTPLLREVSVGSLFGMTRAQAMEMHGDIHRQRLSARDFTVYCGENTQMQYDRIAEFMETLEKADLDGNVAVFCHEGTVKCMLSYVLQAKIPWNRYLVDNGAVSVFIWDGKVWKLQSWNMTR